MNIWLRFIGLSVIAFLAMLLVSGLMIGFMKLLMLFPGLWGCVFNCALFGTIIAAVWVFWVKA